MPSATSASVPATGSAPSPGTPTGILRHTSRRLPSERWYTLSTSGSPPTTSYTSSTTPATKPSSSTLTSRPLSKPSPIASPPFSTTSSWAMPAISTPRCLPPSPTKTCWPRPPANIIPPWSTNIPSWACATPRPPPGCPKVLLTPTAPFISTPSPSPPWTSSAFPSATASWLSFPCFTPTVGDCPTSRPWSAPTRYSPAAGPARGKSANWWKPKVSLSALAYPPSGSASWIICNGPASSTTSPHCGKSSAAAPRCHWPFCRLTATVWA